MDLRQRLYNKKILFFSVQTFGLEVEIKSKLEDLGAHVVYFDERPFNNNFIKGIIRIKRNLVQNRIDDYYKKILKRTAKTKFDYLFVNRGEIVPAFFLEKFKNIHPNCRFVFYTWDSFTNNKHPISILKYFDRKFTFDPNDASEYKINFRPLFFLDEFRNIKTFTSQKPKYNLLFLGTAHTDRYKISTEITTWCRQNGLTSFCYYYMHGRLVYLYKWLFDKSFKKFQYKKLSFKSLSLDSIIDLYKESDVILDINHIGQKGLTMRTFESLGSGKKLITTNDDIKNYCFYNPNNIFIINRNNVSIDKHFFESSYEDIDPFIYDKMSIEGWINCIFFEYESGFWISNIE